MLEKVLCSSGHRPGLRTFCHPRAVWDPLLKLPHLAAWAPCLCLQSSAAPSADAAISPAAASKPLTPALTAAPTQPSANSSKPSSTSPAPPTPAASAPPALPVAQAKPA